MPIIINTYFDDIISDITKLLDIGKDLEKEHGIFFNEFGLHYLKPLNFNDEYYYKDINELSKQLRKRGKQDLFSIYFTIKDLANIHNAKISVKFRPTINPEKTPYNQLYFHIDDKLVQQGSKKTLFKSNMERFSTLGDLQYGFMHQMPYSKIPVMYFFETLTSDLSFEERNRIYTWKVHKKDYCTKIWDVFTGNAITHKHLSGSGIKLDDIELIVGQENIIVQDNLFLIFLPDNREQEAQIKLKHIFSNNNLLMKTITESDYYDSLRRNR